MSLELFPFPIPSLGSTLHFRPGECWFVLTHAQPAETIRCSQGHHKGSWLPWTSGTLCLEESSLFQAPGCWTLVGNSTATVAALGGFGLKIPTAFWIPGHPYAWDRLFLSWLKLSGLTLEGTIRIQMVQIITPYPTAQSRHCQGHWSHYNCRDSKSSHCMTGSSDSGSWWPVSLLLGIWAPPFWTILCISTRWSKVWSKIYMECGNHKQRNTNKSRTQQSGR